MHGMPDNSNLRNSNFLLLLHSANMTKAKHGKLSTKIELIALVFALTFMPSICRISAQQNEATSGTNQPEEVSTELENESKLLTYIVHVKKPQDDGRLQYDDLHEYYHSLFPDTAKNPNQQRLVFFYRNVVTGFAVKLTAEEARALEEKEEVVSARPERILSLHTTHTPTFLGLQQGLTLWKGSNYGKGVIIGLLDTGIYSWTQAYTLHIRLFR